MKVKKLEIFWNKISLTGCIWSSLNALGSYSPFRHPLLSLSLGSHQFLCFQRHLAPRHTAIVLRYIKGFGIKLVQLPWNLTWFPYVRGVPFSPNPSLSLCPILNYVSDFDWVRPSLPLRWFPRRRPFLQRDAPRSGHLSLRQRTPKRRLLLVRGRGQRSLL